jgi:putative PIN family toxin of toxin-antitoxin system
MTTRRRPAASRPSGARLPPRVVLDSNVVLSALLFGHGAAGQVRHAWQAGRVTPLACAATVAELVRVLAYPKLRLTPEEQHELLADFLPYATPVAVPEPPPEVPPCRDPHDLPFLHLAAAGRARLLVTGDADLLALAGLSGLKFRIVSVAEFVVGLGQG